VKHYSQTEWADYAREVVTEQGRASMQKHLDDGCQKCQKTLQTWEALAEVARREQAFEPPESALRIAKSYIFPLKAVLCETRDLKLAQCTFDSFQRQAVTGIRGSDTGRRQLMYQSGDFFIDMNWGAASDGNRLVLTGQVVDAKAPSVGVVGIPVSLISGGDNLCDTTTSQLGEFHFSLKAARDLKLLFKIDEDALLVLLPQTETGVS
jgi:hypothetical protein